MSTCLLACVQHLTLATKLGQYTDFPSGTIKLRGREHQDWLIQLANREGAWP